MKILDGALEQFMLSKVHEVAPALLISVRAIYGQVSSYVWTADGRGQCVVYQAEGIEQGAPLARGLYALAQHVR